MGVFGHAGDGNFHPTFVMDRDDPDAERRIDAVRADMFERGARDGRHDLRRARHGRGQARLPGTPARRTDYVRVMRAIKTALDPLGILNPGKVLPD